MPIVFRKFLWISVGVHIALFLFILLSPGFFNLFPEKKTKITWIKLTKGTGEEPSPSPYKKAKGMPESTIREQKEALKDVTKAKEKARDKTTFESPVKKKQAVETPPVTKKTAEKGGISRKSESDRKMEEALARVQEQLEKREVQIEAAQIEKEGAGQSPYGSMDIQDGETNPALIAYYEAVKKKINQEWITTPKALEEGKQLRTQITVLIDSVGSIIRTEYELKSDDPSFDLSAMRAVERSAPFPPPPEEIKDEALTEGFLIEFNPRTVLGSFSR
ncbi:MAG: cell envelope integrity protein TolA [Deltaproteobacteria bacterium]|nr:cell envelope integrity protein TolA [Deltaproteobacteria bacterium]